MMSNFWDKTKSFITQVTITSIIVFILGVLLGISLGTIKCNSPRVISDTTIIYKTDTFVTPKDTLILRIPTVGKRDTLFLPDTVYIREGSLFTYEQEYPLQIVYSEKLKELWVISFRITKQDSTQFNYYHKKEVGDFEVATDAETKDLLFNFELPSRTKKKIAKFNIFVGGGYSIKNKIEFCVRPTWTFFNRFIINGEGSVYSSSSDSSRYNLGVNIGWVFGE